MTRRAHAAVVTRFAATIAARFVSGRTTTVNVDPHESPKSVYV
ncbi:MAG TPA: hypothetical protein VFA56_08070 [Gaiellaceae bacterium]|nr:hypothetical protein [Gaiellaceae bacterium]